MNLSPYGVFVTYNRVGVENAAELARLVQDLGFGALWLGGSPEPDGLRPLLAATDTLLAATGIVNLWRSRPETVAAQTADISGEYGSERVLIGIGVGHPEATSDYTRPLAAMRRFLDGLDQAPAPLPVSQRILAALGPKMLDEARERSLGSHPYFQTVEHTRFARERLGDGPLLAVELACVLDPDVDRGRAVARDYARMYLGLANYTNNLLRFDFTEADVVDGGSERLIDAVVPHGSAEEIADAVRAHLDAGADHVCLQVAGVQGVPRDALTALARALGL